MSGLEMRLVDAVYVASGPSSQCLESDCGGCQPLTHCRPCLGYEKVGGSKFEVVIGLRV